MKRSFGVAGGVDGLRARTTETPAAKVKKKKVRIYEHVPEINIACNYTHGKMGGGGRQG
jgi:hypothetical protein